MEVGLDGSQDCPVTSLVTELSGEATNAMCCCLALVFVVVVLTSELFCSSCLNPHTTATEE